MGSRGPKPLQRISTVWTAELAYAVGLITTDGCLSKDGRHIDFTSKDVQLIDLFKKVLNIEHLKTGLKTSGYSEIRYPRVQIGDVNFYQWLRSIGLTPKKSRTLTSIRVPDEFFFDFLRGCFDGDGTIYSFWDKRWVSSFMFYIAFASGSKEFLLWLQQRIKSFLQISGHIAPATRNTFQLKYAKRESLALFKKMHYSNEVPCLRRKLIKAEKIFRENELSLA